MLAVDNLQTTCRFPPHPSSAPPSFRGFFTYVSTGTGSVSQRSCPNPQVSLGSTVPRTAVQRVAEGVGASNAFLSRH